MWAWQLWICLDSIYLFATWTLVSVVVGTTQIQSWSFFWTDLQLCFSIYTSFKRVFFGANKAPCCLGGSKLSGSFSYFPNSKCTAPCMLKLMWELWIWHFSCWSSCDTMDLTFPFRLTDLQEGRWKLGLKFVSFYNCFDTQILRYPKNECQNILGVYLRLLTEDPSCPPTEINDEKSCSFEGTCGLSLE